MDLNFCFLDYTYEELEAIGKFDPLVQNIKNSGSEGASFLKGLEDFLGTRAENAVYEPTDVSDDWELRAIWTYRLPIDTVEAMNAFVEGFDLKKSRQTHNV